MKKLIRNNELNSKTVTIGTIFWRERTNIYSKNDYFKCVVIEKNGSNITFEQYNEEGKQIATRTAKIMPGKLAFKYESYTDYSSINNELKFRR